MNSSFDEHGVRISESEEPVSLELGPEGGREPFEIELRFASSLPMTSVVGPIVNQLSKIAGLDASIAHEVELCTVEAVTNSIEHGCGLSPEHEVCVGFRTEADQLELRIFDTAPPVNLDIEHRDPVQELEGVPDVDSFRGRGLFIMQRLMESVRFQSSDEGPWHNKLTMERRLSSHPET